MYQPCHSLNFAKTLLAQPLKDFVDNRKAQPEVLAQVNECLFTFQAKNLQSKFFEQIGRDVRLHYRLWRRHRRHHRFPAPRQSGAGVLVLGVTL
jgi:hypothetical protein